MIFQVEPLLQGENALDNAPKAELADGRFCIPQHYLFYQHTLKSVEAVVLNIEFDPRYAIIVSRDQGGIYIQIGIIGHDNYLELGKQEKAKLVYGRKWRVESQLPTSEIIQTVFLALKKAREHEVRELFRLSCNGKITTPFNNHHDSILLSNSQNRLAAGLEEAPKWNQQVTSFVDVQESLELLLKKINYDGALFELSNVTKTLSNHYLVELKLHCGDKPHCELIELAETRYLHLVVENLNFNNILHQIMQQLINLSDRYVDEHFYYSDFNRFSWQHDIHVIAQLSSEVRQLHKQINSKQFTQRWQKANYETDRSRIPILELGPLWVKIKEQISEFAPIESTLPITKIC
ncbi:MAG: hypothetical protein ACI9ES_003541 [Oceanospirillaceae bacterium]|jgi:hypothetical protein